MLEWRGGDWRILAALLGCLLVVLLRSDDAYLLLASLRLLLLFELGEHGLQLLLIGLYLGSVALGFLGEECFFCDVGVHQLFVAELPNAIEDSGSEAVYRE